MDKLQVVMTDLTELKRLAEDVRYALVLSPATVLSLIAQIEHLTAEREKDREALEESTGVIRAINHELRGMAHANGRSMRAENIARAYCARLEDTHD